jgi:hypothetical protein
MQAIAFNAMVLGAPSVTLQGVDFDGAFVPENWQNLPDQSTFLYSQATDFSSGEAVFPSEDSAGNVFVGIEMTALSGGSTEELPIEIWVNDILVLRDESPFDTDDTETIRWWFRDSGAIQPGENTLRVENMAEQGGVGDLPWLLIDEVIVYFR